MVMSDIIFNNTILVFFIADLQKIVYDLQNLFDRSLRFYAGSFLTSRVITIIKIIKIADFDVFLICHLTYIHIANLVSS